MFKITVVISAHKESPLLIKTIQSVLTQEFDDYEIILSSDGCEELVDLADRYEINYSFSPKKNHARALNLAVFRSNAPWVKDIHWDDLMLPNCLRDLWECRGGSLVYANAINFWSNGKEKFYRGPENITKDMLQKSNPIHSATIMFRRDDYLKAGGMDDHFRFTEDWDLYVNLFSKGYKLVHCDKTVARYRKHPEQITSMLSEEEKIKERLYLQNKYYDFWNSSSSDME